MLEKSRRLQAAVLLARKLNPAIGIAVKAGCFQIQQITYDAKGVSAIEPVSGWLDYAACLAQLKTYHQTT